MNVSRVASSGCPLLSINTLTSSRAAIASSYFVILGGGGSKSNFSSSSLVTCGGEAMGALGRGGATF